MRRIFVVFTGLMFVATLWAGGIVWPMSEGYYSIMSLVKDRIDRSYARPFDRTDLRADLVSAGFRMGDEAFIRIFKRERRLEMWMRAGSEGFKLFRTYDICNYSGNLGPKLAEGDRQSPEGFYQISASQLNPNSRHHLSFNLAFPNVYDRARERTGTYLMVHGGCTSIGCYAVTDEKVDEIYAIVEAALDRHQDDVPVHIFPFEMSERTMVEFSGHRWTGFWQNLKQGYDLFEQDGTPPKVGVCGTDYVFGDDTDRDSCELVSGWS